MSDFRPGLELSEAFYRRGVRPDLDAAGAGLVHSAALSPSLAEALDARDGSAREAALMRACAIVAAAQNDLGICAPVEAAPSRFHDRPFLVIHGERFSGAIRATIRDRDVLALPEQVGGIDQWSDSADLLSRPRLRTRVRPLYRSGDPS